MKKVSILVPCYNEAAVLAMFQQRIANVIDTCADFCFELLYVNDGSTDDTLAVIKQLKQNDERVCYLDLSRNFGKEIAMAAGLDYVTGDAVIIIDADLQDPPELIPSMLTYWEQGYNDVYAKRISRQGETFFKRFSSKLYYRLLQKLTEITIQIDVGDFRLLDRKCIEALRQMRETNRYTKGFFSWIGYRKKEISYEREPRAAGKTKWNYFKLFDFAIEGILSFTTKPLRISTFFGFFISIASILYMLFFIAKTLIYGIDVAGYPSIISFILFIGGVQLMVLGILGEYVGRIFTETKNRPLYLINEYKCDKNFMQDK